MRKLGFAAVVILLLASTAWAGTISFDDNPGARGKFSAPSVGLSNYQGYTWSSGWAIADAATNPAIDPAPTPVSGDGYAWNFGTAHALSINFGAPVVFTGGYFADLSEGYSGNADTVQLFGYDSHGNLVATSGILNLTYSFQDLSVSFSGVSSVSIVGAGSDPVLASFAVDNLTVYPAPEPGTLLLLGSAFLGLGATLRRLHRIV